MENYSAPLIILMADDDEDDCLLVESAFRKIGNSYDLRFVDDGQELLDYLHNKGNFSDPEQYPMPNLILLDLNMPRMDGREALTKIKSDPHLRDIPILILTTSREKKDIDFTKESGAASFLTKPDAFEDLTDMLGKFCTAILHNPNIDFQVIGVE